MDKVERQKGEIKVGIPTYRTMTHPQRAIERDRELTDLRGAQTLTTHIPKTTTKKS